MRLASLVLLGWFGLGLYFGDLNADEPKTVRLWEADAPNALGKEDKDVPTAIVYWPAASAKPVAAMVICPGGGYQNLAMDHEGKQIAQWANRMGMAGIICSYRHHGRGYGYPNPLLDAQRTMRLVRHRASEWNIDPHRIGILGFSAGGHLASTVLTHFDSGQNGAEDPIDRESCRPDFGILCYPVIAFDEPFTHHGSQVNLLGEHPDPDLVRSLSNEKQVTDQTPPVFLFHTQEDKVVNVENSIHFFSALTAAGVKAELHIFPDGPHGVGLAASIPGTNRWPDLCRDWLYRSGFADETRTQK